MSKENSEEDPTYYIPINDSMLNEYGFTRFELPVSDKAKHMKIQSSNNRLITFCKFYHSDLDKTKKSVRNKFIEEQLIPEQTAKDLAVYFENECKV